MVESGRTYHKVFCIADKINEPISMPDFELSRAIGVEHTVKLEKIEIESEWNEAIGCMRSEFFLFETVQFLFYNFCFLKKQFRLTNSNALSKVTNDIL